ncbi:MAG: hypothetical protein AAFP81_01020 [Pseudomonadota bacterium]
MGDPREEQGADDAQQPQSWGPEHDHQAPEYREEDGEESEGH